MQHYYIIIISATVLFYAYTKFAVQTDAELVFWPAAFAGKKWILKSEMVDSRCVENLKSHIELFTQQTLKIRVSKMIPTILYRRPPL